MSAYKRLVCESITDENVLLEALKRLGLEPEQHMSAVTLYNYTGEASTRSANIVIPRSQVKARFGGAPNDLGFLKENDKWIMQISEYDDARKIKNKVEQAYTCVALEKALKSSRFQVDIDLSSLGARVGRDIKIVGKKVI